MKFVSCGFFENLSRNFKFHSNRTKIKDTLHEDHVHFLTKSRSFLLRMRHVSNKICRENGNTFCVQYFFFENLDIYEKVWKNIVARDKPQMAIWRMRIACWIPKAINTHTQVVQYSLLFHCNSGYTNAPKCYFIRTLPVLFLLRKVCSYFRHDR